MDARSLRILLENLASRVIWHFAGNKYDIGNVIPVLCYHRILPDLIEKDKPTIYTMLPKQFESHLAFLAEDGFTSLGLEEYVQIARGLKPPPRRSVLITFDDGYVDNYEVAWPISQKYHIKLNLFICTNLIGEENPVVMTEDGYKVVKNYELLEEGGSLILAHLRKFPQLWRPLNWLELREMQAGGVQIGFHSHFHRNLTLLSPKEIAVDIATGQAALRQHLGFLPKVFALPYGWHTPKTVAVLRQFDLKLIFAFYPGRTRLPSDQLVFPRISISQQDDLATFKRKLYGAYDRLWWIYHQIKNNAKLLLG